MDQIIPIAAKFYPKMFGDRVMNEQTASVTVEIEQYADEPKVIGEVKKLESKD